MVLASVLRTRAGVFLWRAGAPRGLCSAPITFKVPAMGDSIVDGQIAEWVKNVGDAVAADEVVCIIDTDKIAVEINMPEPGVISGHLFSVDDTVEVGQDLFQYVAGNVDVSKLPPPPAAPVAAEKVAPAPVVAAPKADASHSVRSPSMRFPPRVPLELRMPMSLALARHKLDAASLESWTPPAGVAPSMGGGSGFVGVDVIVETPAKYARMPITDAMIEAIEDGGASAIMMQ